MTAQELRSMPEDILNELLVNPENANSEFAIIYTVKTGDDTTETYKPEIRIQGDKQYFENKGLVMEISLNNGDKKIIHTTDISKAEMEKFMSWLAARQQGKGDIFYQINTTNRQYFINYFMITSVDVFDESSYYESRQAEEEVISPLNMPINESINISE